MTVELDLAVALRDVHPPPEPPWWPPAPGWWILLLVALILLAIAIRYARPRWRRWRIRRRLLAELEAIGRRHRGGALETATAADVSQLLRRAALECYPQIAAAGLVGDDWIAFLAARDRTPGRFESLRNALIAAPYRSPGTQVDANALLVAVRGWLRPAIWDLLECAWPLAALAIARPWLVARYIPAAAPLASTLRVPFLREARDWQAAAGGARPRLCRSLALAAFAALVAAACRPQ